MSMESPFLLVCLVASLASLSRVLAQPVCVQPDAPLPSDTSPSDSGHVLVTTDADAARNTALCHVACINLLYANGNSDTNGTGNDTDGTIDTDGTGNDTDGIVVRFSIIIRYFAVCYLNWCNGSFISISPSAAPQPPPLTDA